MDTYKHAGLKFSIIIPCYDERNTFQNIIDAVHSSPVLHEEIILVDNCSDAKVTYYGHNQGRGLFCERQLRSN